ARPTAEDGTAVVAVGPGARGRLVPFAGLARVQPPRAGRLALRRRARGRGRPLRARALPQAVAAALVAALLGGGTVAVSADSLPGDALYPAKIAAERVQLATTRDEAGRARLHIAFADRRLSELEKQVERGDAPGAVPLAATYSDEVQAAATAIAHVATAATSPTAQETVAQLSAKLLEETTVRALKLEQVAERAPAVKPKLEEARATAAQAVAVAAAPKPHPTPPAGQPVAASVAQPRPAGTRPPPAQPTPPPVAAAAPPTLAPTHPEGTRPRPAPPPPTPARRPAAEAALAPPTPPAPPQPPGPHPERTRAAPTALEQALATSEAQAGKIAAAVRAGTTAGLEDLVRRYTAALEHVADAFAADVAAGRSRDQAAAALAARLSVQYETLVRAAEQASPADQPKLRQALATIAESMRGVLDDLEVPAPSTLQPAPTTASQPAASPMPRPLTTPTSGSTMVATPVPPTAVPSLYPEGTLAPASPTGAAAQAPPAGTAGASPVATSGPAASTTPAGSPPAPPTAPATAQPASPTAVPTRTTTPSPGTNPTPAAVSPSGASTPTVQPQPSPTAAGTPPGAMTPMRLVRPTATPGMATGPASPAPEPQ
ncbi:MAG TPA: DUF5667 domain-containing protein, partial [Chloroflexota bacterium]|nr:DUF5667 domain-containing protein [Chloroflexota bacterium]